MAEIILTTIATDVLGKLTSLVSQEIGLAWGVKTELKKFKNTMRAINAVLLDAEQQQTKSHAVKLWLEQLKDVVYDIDDVLDDFSFEVNLRKNVKTHRGILKEVRHFFSKSNPFVYRLNMGHKMKEIRERLDEIASNRNFQLSEHVVETRVQMREGTHSFVQESGVIGRDQDKKNIVQLIMDNNNQTGLLVIPIVGLGGLGKTTLAKLAYNDTEISCSYELKMWVCVSEDSKLNKVIERIIKSATGETCEGLDSDQLQSKLRRILNSKKFLLVLDDLWEDDPRWWTEVRDLLIGGAVGNTVIVTTRNSHIASIVGTTASYNLSELPFDDCLSLFLKCAFKEGKEKARPELMKIGKEIVKKCGGVPLAVRFLGSLLYMKTDVGEWSYIMNNDILALEQKENNILPALRLSYEQLPAYLKPCFVYCCIFPKNLEIQGYVLINFWIALGLLQSRHKNERLEDIGNQYLNELLSRSFFQNVERFFDNATQSVKMHDLVHDLARSVAGTESLEVDIDYSATSENVRHLLFTGWDLLHVKFPKSLVSAKKVRSFKFAFEVGPINQNFVETLVMSFMRIRVLDLSGSTFEVLPRFICKLKHLRFLSLEGNCSLKALPNSICKLLNLQFLSLLDCDQLQDLPRDFGNFISLRYLIVTSQMVCMPKKGLRGLISLQTLWFHQCDQLESLPEEIQHLTALRELIVSNCSTLASLPSGMKCLTALEELVITDCPELHLSEEGEDMSGLKSLRTISIRGLPKLVALPHGIVQSASTLQYLRIDNCPGLMALPGWFGNLTSLQVLYIENCPNLLSLPKGMQCLPSLRELSVVGSPHLIERCEKGKGEDWPKISHIPEIYYYGLMLLALDSSQIPSYFVPALGPAPKTFKKQPSLVEEHFEPVMDDDEQSLSDSDASERDQLSEDELDVDQARIKRKSRVPIPRLYEVKDERHAEAFGNLISLAKEDLLPMGERVAALHDNQQTTGLSNDIKLDPGGSREISFVSKSSARYKEYEDDNED